MFERLSLMTYFSKMDTYFQSSWIHSFVHFLTTDDYWDKDDLVNIKHHITYNNISFKKQHLTFTNNYNNSYHLTI